MTSLGGLLVAASVFVGQAEEPSHEGEMQLFAAHFLGEWVNETVTDRDLPGAWKKGDKLVAYLKFEPIMDGKLLMVSWWGEVNDTPSHAKAKAIIGWDSSSKQVAGTWFGNFGERGEFHYTRVGDHKWVTYGTAVRAGGVKSSDVAEHEFADDGDSYVTRLTHRTLDGKPLPDKRNIWKRK